MPKPDPEPDPVPVWNGVFTWNEEQHTFIILNYIKFYKEAITQQQMYNEHCFTSYAYKY